MKFPCNDLPQSVPRWFHRNCRGYQVQFPPLHRVLCICEHQLEIDLFYHIFKFFRSIGSIMIRFLHFFFYLQIFVRADSCLFHFIMFILCFWDIRFFPFKFFEFLVFMNANLCIPDTLVFVLIFGVYKSAVVSSWILCRRGAIFVNGIPRLKVSKKTVNVKLQWQFVLYNKYQFFWLKQIFSS